MTGFPGVKSFFSDSSGGTTLEWTLVLAVFGIPMILIFTWLLAMLSEHYGMVTSVETLPLP